jgi:large subunit ribosomal protein L7/L12
MANLEKIVDELSSLTVLEAADLAKLLEEKWGVSAAAAVAVAAAPAGGAAAAPVEEQTEFSVILAQARQGRREQGRGREDQGGFGKGWGQGRDQVMTCPASRGSVHQSGTVPALGQGPFRCFNDVCGCERRQPAAKRL